MSGIRALLISEEYPPYTFGGIGSVCYDLAESLSERDVLTTVLCGRSRTNKIDVEKPNNNLRIVRLPFFDIPPRFFWFQLQNSKIFMNLVMHHQIIHVVNPQAGILGVYFKKKFSKPLITSIHGIPIIESKVFFSSPINFWTKGDIGYNLFEYPLNAFSTKLCLANSEQIAVCSATTANELKTVYPRLKTRNTSIIYNGVNFGKIDKIKPDSSRNRNEGVTILYFGRLYYRKGILEALKAVANLVQRKANVRFEIFGRGPLEHRIDSLIHKWRIQDIVHLKGHVTYEEVIRAVKKSDIVLLPSLYEAQSISILEAMACKKPVIAYDFPFSREIITHMHNGILAKRGNVNDLASKIELLASDRILRRRLGENAYSHVKRKHDWRVLINRYITLYNNPYAAA